VFPAIDKNVHDINITNEYDTKVSTAYLVCAVITGTGYIIKPPINFIFHHLILQQPYTAEMPTVSEFLYDISKSPAFELTYFVSTCAVFTRVLISVSQFEIPSIFMISSIRRLASILSSAVVASMLLLTSIFSEIHSMATKRNS
jgi:hypothetical protein